MGGKDLQVFLPDPRYENTGAAAGQAGQQAQHTLARYQYRVKCGSNETCSIHCLKKKKKRGKEINIFLHLPGVRPCVDAFPSLFSPGNYRLVFQPHTKQMAKFKVVTSDFEPRSVFLSSSRSFQGRTEERALSCGPLLNSGEVGNCQNSEFQFAPVQNG